jgi:hypothetical protein
MTIRHKTGGRRQGTPNKRTLERQAATDELLAAGTGEPIRRSTSRPPGRLPRMSSVAVAVDVGNSDGGPLGVGIAKRQGTTRGTKAALGYQGQPAATGP